MSWTDERVETLKAMWAEGKSASQIAKELGGVTRNAVIGKVHRLGLSNRVGDHPAEPGVAGAPEAVFPAAPEAAAEPAGFAEPGPAEEAPRSEEIVEEAEAEAAPRPQGAVPPAGRLRPQPGQPLPPQPANAEMSAETLANLAEVAKKAKRLGLMQLTERTCKWPVGDPATDDFWFCGLPATAGKPYCDTHVSVAFQPMSSRRDRRSSGR
jgi:GcrA cell cycle regulator